MQRPQPVQLGTSHQERRNTTNNLVALTLGLPQLEKPTWLVWRGRIPLKYGKK